MPPSRRSTLLAIVVGSHEVDLQSQTRKLVIALNDLESSVLQDVRGERSAALPSSVARDWKSSLRLEAGGTTDETVDFFASLVA